MEDQCSTKPGNLKEFVKSSWFQKPLLVFVIGSILGILLYGFLGSSPYAENIYADMLAGIVIGLFFINIPCLSCNFSRE
jgi:hypothetical protein